MLLIITQRLCLAHLHVCNEKSNFNMLCDNATCLYGCINKLCGQFNNTLLLIGKHIHVTTNVSRFHLTHFWHVDIIKSKFTKSKREGPLSKPKVFYQCVNCCKFYQNIRLTRKKNVAPCNNITQQYAIVPCAREFCKHNAPFMLGHPSKMKNTPT